MNTEQINRFDELMRNKLSYYEEEPDMELLPQIHARKNRFLQRKNVIKLIVLLAVITAGFLIGSALTKQREQTNTLLKHGHQATEAILSSTSPSDSKRKLLAANSSENSTTTSTKTNHQLSGHPTRKTPHSQTTFQNSLSSARQSLTNINLATQLAQSPNHMPKSNLEHRVAVPTKQPASPTIEDNPAAEEGACHVDFDYVVVRNTIQLSPTVSVQDYKLTWFYGDGQISNAIKPSHQYKLDGSYTVTLLAENTNNTCKAKVIKQVEITTEEQTGASVISGTVFADAAYASKKRVELLKYNDISLAYDVVQSTYTNVKGAYEFEEVSNGNYLIRVTGDAKFNSTYYGNVEDAELASSILVLNNDYKDLFGYDIQLNSHVVAYQSKMVSADSNSKWVIVYDQNNNPVASVLVNANGEVESNNTLPNGKYKLVNPNDGSKFGDLDIEPEGARVVKSSQGQGVGNDRPAGISGIGGMLTPEVTLAPNPATDVVRVGLSPSTSDPIEVVILNSVGAIVRTYKFDIGSMQRTIDISALSIGTYYVVVKQNGVSTSTRLIKTDDK